MSVQDPSRVKHRNDGDYSTVLLISKEGKKTNTIAIEETHFYFLILIVAICSS